MSVEVENMFRRNNDNDECAKNITIINRRSLVAQAVNGRPLITEVLFQAMLFHVGFILEKVIKIFLSPSLSVLSSVPTTTLQVSAPSFIYHQRHIILAGVSVNNTLKNN